MRLSARFRIVAFAAFDRKRGGLAAFERRPETGALRQLGCVAFAKIGRCSRGRALAGIQGVSVSPDGRNLYTAALGSPGGVAVFTIR